MLPLTIIFGANEFKSIAHEYGYGMLIPEEIPKERTAWKDLVNEDMKEETQALDLLDKMLKLDQNERITPDDALAHPFFEGISI